MKNLFLRTGATFSACRQYRYALDRRWDDRVDPVAYVMLNPSTADEERNDPTVERCARRAAARGFGGLVVVNLFAWRSTDPRALTQVADPIGPDNDWYIAEACQRAGRVICAWGTDGRLLHRDAVVLDLIRAVGKLPYCLGVNADGTPKHPLYVPYTALPVELPS
jgi:hypothetical protein